ncbi:MAG TPA: RIP metalloprotease RseP [Anaerovoracaceae bacterium]|nr:RIP metalloprotease RseP [Anaerovoracaceae bacterium]
MVTALLAILLFCLMIFPHELGHFVVAKAVGVKVNEFAMGMGPALYKKQKGETLYALRAIPIGGYCAMEGENEESEDNRAFNNKPGWAKISVLVAGAAMNVLIAIIVLSLMLGVAGSATTIINEVEAGSPAAQAGLQTGDKLLTVDGKELESWNDLSAYIAAADGKEISITILRDKQEMTIETTPAKEEDRYIIGVTPKASHNVFTAIGNGVKASWGMTKMMFSALKQLVTGEVSVTEMTGPVGIVSLVNDTNKYGLWYFGYLTALISLNLAIINLLPLPALDGGRILFVIIRRLTGKMITDKLEGTIHTVGLLLLFGLMIYVTWNDITRIFL